MPFGWLGTQLFYEISCAYLAFHDTLLPGKPERLIIWSDYEGFHIDKIDNSIHEPAVTYIAANMLRWRIINE